MDILKSTAKEIATKIKSREIKAEEVVGQCLKQIDKHNKDINAFISVSQVALEQAKKILVYGEYPFSYKLKKKNKKTCPIGEKIKKKKKKRRFLDAGDADFQF